MKHIRLLHCLNTKLYTSKYILYIVWLQKINMLKSKTKMYKLCIIAAQ